MLNRREAIALSVGILVTGKAGDVGANGESETSQMLREEPARFAAEWESMALRSNCPNTWRTWRYASGAQWTPTSFVIFGVGPEAHVEAEYARHCAGWSTTTILDAHITPDRRAWALCIEGELSDGLRKELRKYRPSFDDLFDRWYGWAGDDEERLAEVERRLARL